MHTYNSGCDTVHAVQKFIAYKSSRTLEYEIFMRTEISATTVIGESGLAHDSQFMTVWEQGLFTERFGPEVQCMTIEALAELEEARADQKACTIHVFVLYHCTLFPVIAMFAMTTLSRSWLT